MKGLPIASTFTSHRKVEETVQEDAFKLDYRSISCNYFFDPCYWDGCSEHGDTRRHKEREAEGQSGRERERQARGPATARASDVKWPPTGLTVAL